MEARPTRRWRFFAVTAVLATVGLVGTALAVGPANGGPIQAVSVNNSVNASSTALAPWVNVPGASATLINVPAGRHLIIARFTAESACSGQSGFCTARILLDGVEMDPAAGTNFAFDSHDLGDETASSWEAKAMERSRVATYSFAGNHTVQVQYGVTTAGGATFWLDDWHLTVERAPA